MQEPIYDHERLKADWEYRYSKIDELMAYMETIEPYSQRVEYFMNTTLALGLELITLNIGRRGIFERQYWSTDMGHPLKFFDKQGKQVEPKWWGLSDPDNDTDKILSRKLWFEKVRHTLYPKFGQKVNETLEQRKNRYFANSEGWDLVDYAKEQLIAIEYEISQFQNEYTAFREGKGKPIYESERVKSQRLNAPTLVKGELLGNHLIDWLAYSRSDELQSFGILWDMVGFALFVKKQISNPTLQYRGSKSGGKAEISSLSELFAVDCEQMCVDALRQYKTDKPILGDGLHWTGNRVDRGLLVSWIEVMEGFSPPKIRKVQDRKVLVSLIKKYFTGLENMGEHATMFDKPRDQKEKDRFKFLLS